MIYQFVLRALITLFCFSFPLYASPSIYRPYVTCRISGQLANEMSQIATTLAYSWDYNVEAIFPELNKTDWNIPMNRDRVFFRLNCGPLPRSVRYNYHEGKWWIYTKIKYRPDQYLDGDFLCWKRFHHYRDRLVQVFSPSSDVNEYLQKKYRWLLGHPKTVSVHVRTYNKEHHKGCSPFIGLDYYKKAMSLFDDDTVFVVFSDRINWCKHHFNKFKKNIIYIDGNDHIQDFFLMSKMKHHILANSGFSWWAAYLNKNPNKKIVSPRQWYRFRPGYYLPRRKNYVFFPDWILIDVNLEAKYPSDMKKYDKRSQSTDTQ